MTDFDARLAKLDQHFDKASLEPLAKHCGFAKRSARKISLLSWLKTFCMIANFPIQNLRTYAWMLGLVEGKCISKQNVAKRIPNSLETLMAKLLHTLMGSLCSSRLVVDPVLEAFGRVIVQDSTTISLPAHMAERFPGPSNKFGSNYATMRIQSVVDLLTERCLSFSMGAFTRNDQQASADILEHVQAGDLVLRDLGYFSLTVLDQLRRNAVDFISRLKPNVIIYDCHDGEQVDLLDQLHKHPVFDREVFIGKKQKLKVRLLALPLPEDVANERRRKARANRDRRLNHSKQYMDLLGWQILITSVPATKMCSKVVCSTYALRWRIETMFKAWKSHFQLGQIPPKASGSFICNLVYAKLIHISLFQCLFQRIRAHLPGITNTISPLKLSSVIQNLFCFHMDSVISEIPIQTFYTTTLYHCRYDKRKDRSHYFQNLHNTLLG
jgi:hypothetical protein